MASLEDIRTNLNLSFLTVRKSAKKWIEKFRRQRLQPAVVVRNEQMCEDHREFIEAVEEKLYNSCDFFKFVSDKYDHR